METTEIKGTLRKEVGKKYARRLRKEEKVPCVMYGGKDVIHFASQEKDFISIVYTPKIFLINLDIEGTSYNVILKDIQFHPVSDKILHIDFIEISNEKPVSITMPLRLTGDSIGIKNGGKLRWKRRHLKVRGLPKDLPDFLDVDITELEIGQTLKIGDLSYENLEILDPLRAMVAAVVSSRLVAKGMEEVIEEPEEVEVEAEEEAAEAAGETPVEGAPPAETPSDEKPAHGA